MKSPTEIHSNSAIELQVYHLIICYHNFCIMSPLSRQQSFPLQVKRICRDSSFVTLMSFSAKLSLPARFFSHCFGSHGRTLNYFCNRLRFTYCQAIRHVISVESWQVESWPSNHVWKSGCIHSNEISCKINKVSDDACQWNGHDVVISIGGICFYIESFVCCMTHEEKLNIQWPCCSDFRHFAQDFCS